MSRWRWAAVAPLCAGIALALFTANARGETFVFQDSERRQQSGKVLVEFPELLFVAIDGQGPTFLRRAELRAIIDGAGKRHESAPLGTFAAIGKRSPAAAVTDVTGDVWLGGLASQAKRPDGDPGGEPGDEGAEEGARPGETLLREQEGGAEFVQSGAGVRTGENGVVHGLFPSGAEFWIGVESEVSFGGPTEQMGLGEGELSLKSRLSPIQVQTARPLDLRLFEASYVVIQRAGHVIKLDQMSGQTRVSWPEFSFALHGGQSVSLTELGKGRWSVAANATNDDEIRLIVKGKPETLGAGKERELGTEAVAETSLWRHVASRGEILLRRGLQGSFRPVPSADRSLLALGPGDALQTTLGGEAALRRYDGARLTLRQASWLEVDGEEVHAHRGAVLVEALGAPVGFVTPGGRASLSQSVVLLKRSTEGRGTPLQVRAAAGRPQIPLGYATLSLDARSLVILSRAPTPVDPPDEVEALQEGRAGKSSARSSSRDAAAGDRRVAAAGQGTGESDSGTGDSGTGDSGTGDSGTGDSGTGDSGTGESGTGDSGTGESGTGESVETPSSPDGAPGELPSGPERASSPRAPVRLLPASSGEQTLPSIRVEVLQGTGQIRSGSVEQLGDPGYVVALVAHDLVEVRPPSILKPLGGIGLLGERELRMRSTGLGVKVLVGLAPELHYEGLAAIRLKEGLVVALDQARGLPVLEFRSGERLLLEEVPVPILIENPTIVIDGYKAVVKFLGGIEAKLRKAGAHGAVAFVTRHDDHLETRKNAKATVQLRLENVELVLDDGRELRIQPKAPPVDARVSDAKGTLFLSMPGAPSLGLRPELALTVLATNEGEFVILDKDRISPERLEQQGLAYGFDDDALLIDSERILDLLDVPIADSPSGP